MNKKEYISPILDFFVVEDLCTITGASVVQGDGDVVIDTFPVEDNPNDFNFDLPDNWGGQ